MRGIVIELLKIGSVRPDVAVLRVSRRCSDRAPGQDKPEPGPLGTGGDISNPDIVGVGNPIGRRAEKSFNVLPNMIMGINNKGVVIAGLNFTSIST